MPRASLSLLLLPPCPFNLISQYTDVRLLITISGLFVYSMDYARTRLSVDSKNAAKGGQRQFSGMIDV